VRVPASTPSRGSGRPAVRALTQLLVAVAIGVSGTAFAYCRLKTGESVAGEECQTSGIPLAWKSPCISYAVFPRATDDPPRERVLEEIDASFNAWMQVECDGQPVELKLERLAAFSECNVPQFNPDGPNVNSVSFVRDWEERGNPTDAFGLTSVWHNEKTGEILDVDIEINDDPDLAPELGSLGICNDGEVCPETVVDIRNVMTHEVGHFLGLGHEQRNNSVMRPQSKAGETSNHELKPDDIAGLCAIYPKGSLSQECSFKPRNGLSLECAVVEENTGCGCAVVGGRESRGRASGALFILATVGLWSICRRRRESVAVS
jgi:hypothetical protein